MGLLAISDTPQVCDGIDGGQEGYLVLRPAPARLLWELDSFSVTQELALAPHKLQLGPPHVCLSKISRSLSCSHWPPPIPEEREPATHVRRKADLRSRSPEPMASVYKENEVMVVTSGCGDKRLHLLSFSQGLCLERWGSFSSQSLQWAASHSPPSSHSNCVRQGHRNSIPHSTCPHTSPEGSLASGHS